MISPISNSSLSLHGRFFVENDQGTSRVSEKGQGKPQDNSSLQPQNSNVSLPKDQRAKKQANSESEVEIQKSPFQLTPEQLKVVDELRARDTEVRTHEAAHLAAAGAYAAGGPSFEYQVGPDGRSYAIGGHVNIDTSSEGDPRQTLVKMQVVRAAALAPADPSAQDLSVANHASQAMAQAVKDIAELDRMKREEVQDKFTEKQPEQPVDELPADDESEHISGYRVNRVKQAYQQPATDNNSPASIFNFTV